MSAKSNHQPPVGGLADSNINANTKPSTTHNLQSLNMDEELTRDAPLRRNLPFPPGGIVRSMPWPVGSRPSRRLNTISEDHDVEGAEASTNILHINNRSHHSSSFTKPQDSSTTNVPTLVLGGVDPTPAGVDIRIGFQNGQTELRLAGSSIRISLPANLQLRDYPQSITICKPSNMDGTGSPGQGNTYQALILDNEADRRVSMVFVQNDSLGKQALTGRATAVANIAGALSNAGGVSGAQSSTNDVAAASEQDLARKKSPPHFEVNHTVSLLSQGLDNAATSAKNGTISTLDINSSADGGSSDLLSGNVQLSTQPPILSGMEEELSRNKPCYELKLVPVDSKTTVIIASGKHYKVPNSEAWLKPYDMDRIMPAARLSELIRPSFLLSIEALGLRKAVEAVNGRRLPIFDRMSIRPVSTISTESRAPATNSEVRTLPPLQGMPVRPVSITAAGSGTSAAGSREGDDNLSQSLEILKSKLTACAEHVSRKADSRRNNSASMRLIGDTIAPRSTEMDGTGGREVPSRTLLPAIWYTRSPSPITRLGSTEETTHSPKTVQSSTSDYIEGEWDVEALLRLSNSTRAALNTSRTLVDEQLKDLLDQLLADEQSGTAEKIELRVINLARLDKLLELLKDPKRDAAQYSGLGRMARSLDHMWKERFEGGYLLIDEQRFQSLFTTGALRGLSLEVDTGTNCPAWKIQRGTPIADTDLEPGHFWLNIQCVYRDGIVDSTKETVTLGRYGTPILPLLTGTEVDGAVPGTYKYRKHCALKDMHLTLLPKVYSRIRILRGSGLQSKYAPSAGVRYDGEYYLKEWIHLPQEDPDVDIRGLELILERVPGQVSVNALRNIPTPAQLDDHALYDSYVQRNTPKASKRCAPSQKADAVRGQKTDMAEKGWTMKELYVDGESGEWTMRTVETHGAAPFVFGSRKELHAK